MILKLEKAKKIKKTSKLFWREWKSLYICTHQNKRIGVLKQCGCGVIGSHARLRIWCREAWGFESLHPHYYKISKQLEIFFAKIAQLVERNLAKVEVAGSSPVFRSKKRSLFKLLFFYLALVVELVDTQDLKSCIRKDVRVQVPSGVLKKPDNRLIVRLFVF